jgi:pimeloyl-ACP methyl ester carboxylesterase
MTYLAIKRGIPVKAAAVIGGVTDVKAWVDARPEMGIVNGNEYIDGFAKIWPDYEHRAEEQYRARSAVYWADQINVPVLILHSRTDRMVPVTSSSPHGRSTSGKEQGVRPSHLRSRRPSLAAARAANRDDRNRMIIDWFNQSSS